MVRRISVLTVNISTSLRNPSLAHRLPFAPASTYIYHSIAANHLYQAALRVDTKQSASAKRVCYEARHNHRGTGATLGFGGRLETLELNRLHRGISRGSGSTFEEELSR